ncbi:MULTISPECIES: anthrone oxygenase family protein [unclassified Rhodococcus (in: high G+C Gram-positive bacteria)]|uniref:anthrone oxygenase family protein n=1 Tax=unclassified Rhodococcus (in: high G+C Gram-positive bacteria) TaxID=192944 RepID=UPI0033979B47
MIERTTAVATMVAAIGCGLIAGVLLAFSICVMPALKNQPPSAAIATMQQINVSIVSPSFLTLFIGSAVAAIVAAAGSIWFGTGSQSLVVVGAILYVFGCAVVTMVVNVPLNDTLATASADSPAGAQVWSAYLDSWIAWNHARTGAAGAACVALTIAVRCQSSL